jgi:hypothetical protein
MRRPPRGRLQWPVSLLMSKQCEDERRCLDSEGFFLDLQDSDQTVDERKHSIES